MAKKKNSFSGSLGCVLAAAGSAVGVGNIWRFPYLCAKDGGGLFLLVYLVLVATFGFVLLTTDVAIGRRTKENALRAFGTLHPKWKFVGYLTFLVPMLIMTYYSVIGGWITKYFFEYFTTSGRDVAESSTICPLRRRSMWWCTSTATFCSPTTARPSGLKWKSFCRIGKPGGNC